MKRLTILSLMVLLGFGSLLHAQNVASHYFLDNLPESNKLNPAFAPNCNFYLDLPVIGSTYGGFISDIGFQDVLTSSNGGSLLNLPMNSPELWDQFTNRLDKHSFIETEANINLLGFGFKLERGYFHFNISQRMNADFRLPSEFFRLNRMADSNSPDYGISHDLSGLGLNATAFTEVSVGISHNINSNLTIGGKLKLLMGQANANLDFESVTLSSSVTKTELKGKIGARVSSPIGVEDNADGDPEFEDTEDMFESPGDIVNTVLSFKNLGYAIDLGVEYMVLPNVSLSASILDLGRINWKNNPLIYTVEGEGKFEGLDESAFLDDNSDEYFENFIDSMGDQFTMSHAYDPYASSLVPKLLIGAEYQVSPVFSAGVMSKTRFYNTGMRENIYFSANLNLYHILTAGAHYNWAWSQPNTFGFTLAVKLLPLQIYVSTDMMPAMYRKYIVDGEELGFPLPTKFNGINAQLGMNLSFGCRKKKNVPLYHLMGDE